MNEPSGSENLLVISRKSSSPSAAGSAGSSPKERLIVATSGRASSGAGGGGHATGGAGVYVGVQKKTSTAKRRMTPANTLARFFMTRIAINPITHADIIQEIKCGTIFRGFLVPFQQWFTGSGGFRKKLRLTG